MEEGAGGCFQSVQDFSAWALCVCACHSTFGVIHTCLQSRGHQCLSRKVPPTAHPRGQRAQALLRRLHWHGPGPPGRRPANLNTAKAAGEPSCPRRKRKPSCPAHRPGQLALSLAWFRSTSGAAAGQLAPVSSRWHRADSAHAARLRVVSARAPGIAAVPCDEDRDALRPNWC